MTGRGEARAIQAIKSDAGRRLIRWVEQFGGIAKKRLEGHVSRGVGLWFEEFVERYLIPGARKLDDKLGVGDYIWKEMIVEVKSGAISADQLARVAAYAAKENRQFVYIFLNKPPAHIVNKIGAAGGTVFYLF